VRLIVLVRAGSAFARAAAIRASAGDLAAVPELARLADDAKNPGD
jgi:hypothetical protein